MAKDVLMSLKTDSGYETLYPKTTYENIENFPISPMNFKLLGDYQIRNQYVSIGTNTNLLKSSIIALRFYNLTRGPSATQDKYYIQLDEFTWVWGRVNVAEVDEFVVFLYFNVLDEVNVYMTSLFPKPFKYDSATNFFSYANWENAITTVSLTSKLKIGNLIIYNYPIANITDANEHFQGNVQVYSLQG